MPLIAAAAKPSGTVMHGEARMAIDHRKSSDRRNGWWTKYLWIAAAILLLIPLIAMRFTNEVAWSALDFFLMGVLLAVVCGTVDLAARRGSGIAYTLGAAAGVGGAFLIVWGNLAVGHEHSPYDLYFYGALATGIVIAAIARFKPAGLMVAMLVTAAALVIVLRLLMVHESDAEGGNLLVTTAGSAMIASPFIFASWLFRKASKGDAK
jgi:hypothetical protein